MPIMTGLAIGAALGGGIAALQKKDILTGALIGGATGALGGAFAPALAGGTVAEGAIASAVPNVAPLSGSVLEPVASAAAPSGITVNGTSLLGNQIPSALSSVSGGAVPLSGAISAPTVANTSSALSAAAPNAGTGFFDSGIGKLISGDSGKTALGIGALGLMGLNKSGSGSQAEPTSYIRPYTFSRQRNPGYTGPGTNYFTDSYTARTPIKSSDYGATSMAEGGIAGLAPDNSFLGKNAIYPMSSVDRTQYASSSQLPTSAAIRDADYDTPTMPYTGQEMIRMAEGGEAEVKQTTQEMPAARQEDNQTLARLMAIQQAQQAYQPPVSQGIATPTLQPQLAEIAQRYSTPQRQAPEAFQYQAPAYVQYSSGIGGGGAGGGGGGDGGGMYSSPGTAGSGAIKTVTPNAPKKPMDTYTGPGQNGDPESYYDRYPISDVYDYKNNQPTRPDNPTSGSPEFNIPSNVPVDPSSGMAAIQQKYANQGYVDYLPNPHNVDGGGGADGGLMPDNLQYADGGITNSKMAMVQQYSTLAASSADGMKQVMAKARAGDYNAMTAINNLNQTPNQNYAMGGGISDLGSYSDGGRLLKGPGNGTSDSIPAIIGARQPARLADGEFVIPSRIVSELGNGSTDAGAKQLYAMMDRVQKARGKTVGKGKVAVDAKSRKLLPA